MLVWLSLAAATTAQSAASDDSLEVALLTCSPGQEVYEYYGHTALLVRSARSGQTYVFNYGVFSYSQPGFVWRFVRGKTDYMVACAPLEYFKREYEARGSSVRADYLNLSQAEAQRLFRALVENCQPENRTYRYNFFYDNCATRVRDMIARALDGQIEYNNEVKRQSLRDIVHRQSAPYKWSYFGQDLLLGAEADRPAPRPAQQFAPDILQEDLLQASVSDSAGGRRPLVVRSEMLVPLREVPLEQGFPLSPLACALGLLALTVCITLWDRKRHRLAWGYDALLLTAQGLAGCIVAFLFFCSDHPAVDSNWLVILFNPLPLFYAGWLLYCHKKGTKNLLSYVNLAVTAGFLIVMCLCPQSFNIAMWLVVLSLLVRAMVQAHFAYHGCKQSNRFAQR